MERVLVTGANGYIASMIVRDLLKDATLLVRGTVRDPSDAKKTKFLLDLEGADRLELVALDLMKSSVDEFKAATAECTYVLHTASPFPLDPPKTEEELVGPAVRGTTTILEACACSPKVKRVVITSSCAAIAFGHTESTPSRKYDETTWSQVENMGLEQAYNKSKTIAEKAAWDFVSRESPAFSLTVVNPAGVFGPSVSPNPGASLEIVKRIMTRELPMLPDIGLGLVDVRDVSLTHVLAMRSPEAAGKRIVNCADELTFPEVGEVLTKEFGPMGYEPVTAKLPFAIIWLGALFSVQMALFKSMWGKPFNVDGSNVTKILGIQYRGVNDAIIDAAHTLIEHGVIEKKPGYRPKKNEAS
mmetsp:Transcript_21650/g.86044  ORF Transcript_21650/g.86044 Transcript_21650/m.86044 type:complete len:358 (-) Transcript_21650:370-1443(-)